MDPNRITYFAKTDARGREVPFGIKDEDRLRHSYVIGKTGMGKSTLLENMAVQDIQNGNGVTFIDPHGSTAEKLLEYVPEERIKDVLYFAPFDLSYPISFNVMEDVDQDKRHLVVNGLMSTFEKIWVDAWSARMAYILQNTLLALLEYPGATLLAVNRMYTDKEFRNRVVENATDPTVRSFWLDEFAKYTDRFAAEATPAIQNKIGQFASNALVRNIIGQPQSAFDMRKLMDEKKIFIVNLSKGRVGEGNANLLGSMLITKIYLAAMSRADATASEMNKLPPHYLYVDEFQSFANKSFADILSEARKYKLSLTIAHQYIEQMEEEVRAAVFGNVGTMITFRVGAYDAEILEKEFAPTFMVEDIVNLGARQIYLKLMIDGVSSQPFSATTLPPIALPHLSHRDQAVAYSRRTYAQPREEVEAKIREWHAPIGSATSASSVKKKPAERPRPTGEKQPDQAPKEKLTALSRSVSNSALTPDDTRLPKPARTPPIPMREEKKASPKPPEPSAQDLRSVLASIARTEKSPEIDQADTEEKPKSTPRETSPLSKVGRPDQTPSGASESSKPREPVPKTQTDTKKKKVVPKEIVEAEEKGRNLLKEALAALSTSGQKSSPQAYAQGEPTTRSPMQDHASSKPPRSANREQSSGAEVRDGFDKGSQIAPRTDSLSARRNEEHHRAVHTPLPPEIPEQDVRRMLEVPDEPR